MGSPSANNGIVIAVLVVGVLVALTSVLYFIPNSMIRMVSRHYNGEVIFYSEPPQGIQSTHSNKYVALTIDDSPSPETNAILDVLQEYDVHATFFLIGKHVRRTPNSQAILDRMLDLGHELGNHMWRDEPSISLDPMDFEQQLLAVDRIINNTYNRYYHRLVQNHDMYINSYNNNNEDDEQFIIDLGREYVIPKHQQQQQQQQDGNSNNNNHEDIDLLKIFNSKKFQKYASCNQDNNNNYYDRLDYDEYISALDRHHLSKCSKFNNLISNQLESYCKQVDSNPLDDPVGDATTTMESLMDKEEGEEDASSSSSSLRRRRYICNNINRRKKKLFRPGSGFFNRDMLATLKQHQYSLCLGNVYPHDPFIRSPRINSWYVTSTISPGSIIILHDRDYTIPTLRTIIPQLQSQGYIITTISNLLEINQQKGIEPSIATVTADGQQQQQQQQQEQSDGQQQQQYPLILSDTTILNDFTTPGSTSSSNPSSARL